MTFALKFVAAVFIGALILAALTGVILGVIFAEPSADDTREMENRCHHNGGAMSGYSPDMLHPETLASIARANKDGGCGCEPRGDRWHLCAYHDGYESGWDAGWDVGFNAGRTTTTTTTEEA